LCLWMFETSQLRDQEKTNILTLKPGMLFDPDGNGTLNGSSIW
jgi:hypothetical protein